MPRWKPWALCACAWRVAKVVMLLCMTQVMGVEDEGQRCKATDECVFPGDAQSARGLLQFQQTAMSLENLVKNETMVSVPAEEGQLAEELVGKTKPSDVHKQCLEDIRQQIIQLFKPRIGISKHVLLIDPAYHNNVGDNLLSYGELCLFHDLHLTHEECSVVQSNRGRDCSPAILQGKQLAFWHAGGNWGDLWQIQKARLDSMEQLQGQGVRTISMPQSYFYKSKELEHENTVRLNEIVGHGFNLSLSWRQENSLNSANEQYPKVDNFLSPDVAFMIGPISDTNRFTAPDVERVDILFVMRYDQESVLGSRSQMEANIGALLRESAYTFAVVDWDDRHKYYDRSRKDYPMRQVPSSGLFDYNRRIGSAVAMLASAKVVVTDRLHGSILAFLMNKPHVYIDQMYKKISLTRLVAFANSAACRRKDVLKYSASTGIEDAVQKAVKLIEAQAAQAKEVKDGVAKSALIERDGMVRHTVSMESIDAVRVDAEVSPFASLLLLDEKKNGKQTPPLGRSMLTTCSIVEVVSMVVPRILERPFGKERLGTVTLIVDVTVWYIASSVYLAASQELLSVTHGPAILIVPLVQVLSGSLLLPLSAFGESQSFTKSSWKYIAVLAACGCANYFGSFFAFESLAHNSLVFVSNIRSMETFSTTCLMILFVGERMSGLQLMGIVLAVAGGVLAAYEPQQSTSEHTINSGILAIAVLLVANFLYSLRNVLLSQASELGLVFKSQISTFAVSCSMALPPGVLLVALSLCLYPQPLDIKTLSADPALLVISSVNFVIYNLASFYVLMQVKPTMHVLLLTGKRVVTTLLACSLVSELPSLMEVGGLTTAVIGVLAFEFEKRRQRTAPGNSCNATNPASLADGTERPANAATLTAETQVQTTNNQNVVKQLLQSYMGLAVLTSAITVTCSGLTVYLCT